MFLLCILVAVCINYCYSELQHYSRVMPLYSVVRTGNNFAGNY